jgi:hypothetical protein
MQKIVDSAQAYTRLGELTSKYTALVEQSRVWLAIYRASKNLQAAIRDYAIIDCETVEMLTWLDGHAEFVRAVLDKDSARISNEMDTLNGQIQNGVFNHE